ncbi:MAG: NAD(P)-dependent oxidoreductase [Nitrospina sp.]|jgi:UDP-glucose 4-epimerase|nr:NAD(P)-dependent oxidoreductase [Nitrospina sp.]
MNSANKSQNRIATVVGGSGFIGSHVADRLSQEGYQVRIFDCKDSSWKKPEQDMIIGDLLDNDLLNKVIAGSEIVYNFAALADLDHARHMPIETINVNILGNARVLEACRVNSVKRFIFASTVYVYSREGSFYRCSKQAAENYIEEYQRIYNLDYTILRYGSLYGPRADNTNGLLRIVNKALKTGVVSYSGSPDAFREYIHVEDAAKASVDALGDDFRNQSVVLTGQEPMRVIDLLKMLAEILGFPDEVEFVKEEYTGHYIRTPYAYLPKLGRKYVLPLHVDLGQGLIQLIDEARKNQ